MMRLARATAFLFGTTLAFGAAAQSIPCGVPYIVKPGDTLQRIAVRAYGPSASFHDLVPANRGVFRRGDPSLMEPGQVLSIPCRDGATPDAAAAQPAATPLPRPSAAGDRSGPPTLLTVADAGQSARADVALAAIDKAGIALRRPAVDMAIAPEAVPTALGAAPQGSLARGLSRPDCDRADPGGTAGLLCRALVWSAPIEEVVVSVLTAGAVVTLPADSALGGGPLCRAVSVHAYLLDGSVLGAVPGFEGTAERCVAALRDGSAAAAIMLSTEADAAVSTSGAGQAALVEQFAMARLVTRHVVALADDPVGVAALDRLGSVIDAWQADGTWAALLRGDRAAN
jgi:polar amino acid transport system substrate-binding protein